MPLTMFLGGDGANLGVNRAAQAFKKPLGNKKEERLQRYIRVPSSCDFYKWLKATHLMMIFVLNLTRSWRKTFLERIEDSGLQREDVSSSTSSSTSPSSLSSSSKSLTCKEMRSRQSKHYGQHHQNPHNHNHQSN